MNCANDFKLPKCLFHYLCLTPRYPSPLPCLDCSLAQNEPISWNLDSIWKTLQRLKFEDCIWGAMDLPETRNRDKHFLQEVETGLIRTPLELRRRYLAQWAD